MTPLSLFKRPKKVEPPAAAEPAPPKRPVVTLGVDENGRYRGIFKDERIHMAVVGFPGSGKSRFLLSLALQNVMDGDGVMIIDPHGDLAKAFLSHIPRHRWNDVIYIDPMAARKYGRVVKVNFLECPDVKDRDVVARSFMESLEKIYAKFWGPRLDMILMNAVYALLDAGNTNLSMLYNVIADEQFRETLLEKVTDDKVKNFWRNEFKRMTKDASSAVLTKIYRIVQERIVAPMFDCVKSRIDFRKAMDERRIIVVNLSEGAITSDVANFLGSLILARVYLAGMSREDTPEEERAPFYVYIDEAYRFVSLSIRDILQSLRKYRVYMTLASQYLGQYAKEIAESIPHLCDAIICFQVGEETAKALEEFYRPSLTYLDLVHLPKFTFAASAIVGGKRECQVLRSLDCGWGPTNVEELIKFSLQNYGEEVDMAKYTGVPTVSSLPHPTNAGFKSPLPWAILVALNRLCEEDPKNRFISRDDLVERFREYGVSDVEVDEALRALSTKNYIEEKSYVYDHYYVQVMAEPPLALTPVTCIRCGQPTCRPFRVRGGAVYCRYCIEEAILSGNVNAADIIVPEVDPRTIRVDRVLRRRATKRSYAITPIAKNKFFERVPRGARGGGTEHARAIGAIERVLLRGYCYTEIDLGEETPRRTADGKTEYEAKSLPDMVVYPVARRDGRLNFAHWDSGRAFTVEVEIDPMKHKQRVLNNLKKNRDRWGLPVIFATIKPKWANDLVRILHDEAGEDVVADNTGYFGGAYNPKSVSVLHIDPETETYNFVTPECLMPVREEGSQEAQGSEAHVEDEATVEKAEAAAKPSEGVAGDKAPSEGPGERAERESCKPPLVREEIAVEVEDLRLLPQIFDREPWRLRRRFEGDEELLYAECRFMGKLARVKLGPYERFRRYFELTGKEPPLILKEEARRPPEGMESPADARVEGKGGDATEEGAEGAWEETEEEGEAGLEGARAEIEGAKPPATRYEEKMLEYARQGYKFTIKKIKGRPYLYAQRYTDGKTESKAVAPWNDEVKSTAEKHGITVSQPQNT